MQMKKDQLTELVFCIVVIMVGMTGFEPAASSSRTKRATKLCHIPTTETIITQSLN